MHANDGADLSRRQIMKAAGITTLAGLATTATTAAAAHPAAAGAGAAPRRDGATLVLLGTAGGPTVYTERAGISSAVVVGDAFYLVDLGHGAINRAAAARLSSGDGPADRPLTGLAGVFLTHMHSDHLSEFGSLIINGIWCSSRMTSRCRRASTLRWTPHRCRGSARSSSTRTTASA